MKIFFKIALFFLLVTVFSDLKAQIISWNFSVPSTKGDEESVLAKVKDSNLKESALYRGSGLLGTSKLPRTFMGKVPFTGLENTKEKAFSAHVYYEFSLSPKKKFHINLTTLKCKLRPGAGGPFQYRWAYSLDGGKRFNEIGNSDVRIKYNPAQPDGEYQVPIDLSAISDLQNITGKVVFRMYIWGAKNPKTSTFAIGKSAAGNEMDYVLAVDGEVKASKK